MLPSPLTVSSQDNEIYSATMIRRVGLGELAGWGLEPTFVAITPHEICGSESLSSDFDTFVLTAVPHVLSHGLLIQNDVIFALRSSSVARSPHAHRSG